MVWLVGAAGAAYASLTWQPVKHANMSRPSGMIFPGFTPALDCN